MRPITLTIYMYSASEENPREWDVAEWLGDPTVVGWDITDGHGDCAACVTQEHDVSSPDHTLYNDAYHPTPE